MCGRNMKNMQKTKKTNWLTIIPVIFWICCIGISVGKVVQTGNKIHFTDLMDIVGSNTFSTYVSMIIVMMYQFFSIENARKQEISGLSRRWISLSIIATIAYAVIAVVNACRYNSLTIRIMFIYSIVYVFLFFRFMRIR